SAKSDAAAQTLSVVSRHDGAWADALRGLALTAYTQTTGVPARLDVWTGGLDALRTGLKGGWDVVQLTAQELADACQEGLVEKLDWAAIGGRDHYVQGAANDCGVGAGAHALLLSWDRDKVKGAPTWADFFDIARYPGKRALPKRARGVLEIALLADGVAPGDVYRTLRSTDGTDRAFRKLDQLRPYLDWWQTGREATRILGSGAVLMVAAPNARVLAANASEGRHFGAQWTGAVVSMDWWAIARDTPRGQQAQQLLYLLGLPALEGRLLERTGIAGFAKGSADLLPAAAQANSPLLPANLSGALVADEGFWHDNGERLDGKFAAWLAH
ncbi:extracellular solute-binding protein, partial [Acidisphaera rubrifaciens]|uniref:extracellular solute-binding protein n=1 Tax=Acidisphaera rubrifaciens TaxID=50715 RepID=UPI0006620119